MTRIPPGMSLADARAAAAELVDTAPLEVGEVLVQRALREWRTDRCDPVPATARQELACTAHEYCRYRREWVLDQALDQVLAAIDGSDDPTWADVTREAAALDVERALLIRRLEGDPQSKETAVRLAGEILAAPT